MRNAVEFAGHTCHFAIEIAMLAFGTTAIYNLDPRLTEAIGITTRFVRNTGLN